MTEATKVLVVEDEAAVRELIGLTLKRAGFEFAEAANAQEGRRAVFANPPDLVLLDWMLPDRSGFDLARELRENSATREIPLILLSARRDEHDKVSALNAGADDYVTKPFSPAELIARIKAVLRRARPADLAPYGITPERALERFASYCDAFDVEIDGI